MMAVKTKDAGILWSFKRLVEMGVLTARHTVRLCNLPRSMDSKQLKIGQGSPIYL